MSTIKCPKCANEFDIEEALYLEVQGQLEKQNQEKLNESLKGIEAEKKILFEEKKKLEETKKRENEIFQQKVNQATLKIQEEERKKALEENEAQLIHFKSKAEEAQEQIKALKEKEVEVLKLQNQINDLKRDFNIEKDKYLQENKQKIVEEIQNQEKTKFDLAKKEWEIQREQQNKLIDDLKRKAEQGSMQLQGEAQELLLEEVLQNAFSFDIVGEVPKGKKGADCLLTVRNKFGNDCGKILFESKRTVNWSKDWIEKLKQDAVNCSADIAVLVSQALPDKMEDKFEFRDGILICGFQDVKIVATLLREGIIRTFTASKSQEGRGDKMQMLYDYMTSNEFASQWRAVHEVFRNMKRSIDDERRAMEKLWKNREKQLERALLNSNHIIGAIEGIAGKNTVDLNLLEGGDDDDIAH